jgi:methionine aminopeptidase
MRHAGVIAAAILEEVCHRVAVGFSTAELDIFAKEIMDRLGAKSVTFGFRSGKKVFPGYGCWSVNDEVVHGLPSEKRVLVDGDIMSVDLTVSAILFPCNRHHKQSRHRNQSGNRFCPANPQDTQDRHRSPALPHHSVRPIFYLFRLSVFVDFG